MENLNEIQEIIEKIRNMPTKKKSLSEIEEEILPSINIPVLSVRERNKKGQVNKFLLNDENWITSEVCEKSIRDLYHQMNKTQGKFIVNYKEKRKNNIKKNSWKDSSIRFKLLQK